MARPPPLPPTPSFKQPRSARTYAALLTAAAKVFAKRGFDGAQTPDIAAAAGVSTGAFYRYFDDKRHVFIEMLRHHLSQARAEVAVQLEPSRFAGKDALSAIGTVIDVLVESAEKNVAITRLYVAASLTDPDVANLRATTEAEDRAVLARAIAALAPSDVVANPQAAALVLQLAAVEVALDRAGVRSHAGPRLSNRDVKTALGEMIHRYLMPGGPRSRRTVPTIRK